MDEAFSAWPNSLWREQASTWSFDPVDTSASFDVLIVGAGYSGLWTAFHLLTHSPHLSVAIVDARQPGFGASGRNGGWCSAFSPMSLDAVSAQSSRASAIDLQNALINSVEEIGSIVTENDIECSWCHAGTINAATNPAHLARLHSTIQHYRKYGFDEDFIRIQNVEESTARITVAGLIGSTFSPHCAVVQPALLVDGLVKTLLSRGVHFFGDSRCVQIQDRSATVETLSGRHVISASWIVRATEGFTARMKQFRRNVAPLYSYMIATEVLSSEQWSTIGWLGRETFSDARNMIIYAQRTSDGRIAFGGRGAPYQWASRIGPRFDTNRSIHDSLETSLKELFPSLVSVPISHRWGGALGVRRNWQTSVVIDANSGNISLGGYVGDGVALSYVAARSAAESILNLDTFHARLPIVNNGSRRWEPEPLRFVGINGLLRIHARADDYEKKHGHSSPMYSRIHDYFVP